jgi:hypothetical protein
VQARRRSIARLLTLDDVAAYLVDRRILSTESVVDGDLEIAQLAGRNQNFKITCVRRAGFILKQAVDPTGSDGSVLREARLYASVATEPSFEPVRPFFPSLVESDAGRGVMIARLLPDATSLDEWDGFEPEAAGNPRFLLGRALALVHSQFAAPARDGRLPFLPRRAAPALGGLARPTPQIFADASPANLQLLRIVQNDPTLADLIADLSRPWPIRTIVHGDLQSRNVLVHRPATGPLHVSIVDWELAGVGDPAWDVACMMGDFLERFVLSSVITNAMTPEEIVASNEAPLAAFRRSTRVFWFAYARYVRLPDDAATLLRRAVKLLAGVLLQSAYESVACLPHLTPQALYLLQIGSNVARDVDRAIEELLDLDDC